MIIRVMGQGQYKVDDVLVNQLNVIDNRIVGHISRDDQDRFRKDLVELISLVKEKGIPLNPANIVQSDIIVPPEDLTFNEAINIFKGQGLFEG
jgi:hypothetical protein